MPYRTVPFALLISALAAACGAPPPPPRPVERRLAGDIRLVPDTLTIEGRVPRHATLPALLRQHDLPNDVIAPFVEAVRDVFDVRQLRADRPYRLVRTLDGWLREFEYEIDAHRFLRIVGIGGREPDRFDAEVVPYEKQRAQVALRGRIDAEHPSLFAAVQATGEGAELAIRLAEIFSGEIDFTSDLQRGDAFQVLFESELREGTPAGYGAVLAAEFVNAGRRLRAFRYEVPGEKPGYYDEQGRSLRRFFLRSPLRFEPQVTSGFSARRLHPVLRTYRPHWGVDYRAPAGAPVVAVAAGTVVSAAHAGSGGRTVHLRHADGYESYYLHLSSFAPGVRAGVRVEQGQFIGRVGATGLATGPHLDYRLKKNGRFINPLHAHRDLPPGEPVPAARFASFADERDRALGRLFDTAAPADLAP